MSETEVIETTVVDESADAINPSIEVDAVKAINAIRETARAEFQNELQGYKEQVDSLSQQVNSLLQQLEPLKKFEPVLKKNIKSPLSINIYNLSKSQRELLHAIALEWYPEQRKKFDNDITDISPIDRMLSDLTMKLVESGYKSCWLQHMLNGQQFTVRDGV